MLKQLKFYWRKFWLIFDNRQNLYRCFILERVMDFVRHNQVAGDYFEFGVYRGFTFQFAYHAAISRGLKSMRYFAFDSFRGMSTPQGHDDIGLMEQGERFCSEKDFISNVIGWGVPRDHFRTYAGWFADTLEGENGKKLLTSLQNNKVAVAYLDADLYEPTLLALRFIKDLLQDGSVLCFDNWFLFKANPNRGERKAFADWLNENPQFEVTPFYNFGWHGTSFIINFKLSNNER